MNHHWTGWPGAVCFHCGSDDPYENALADNAYDPISAMFISPEVDKEVKEANVCLVGYSDACPQCQANKKKEVTK